MAKGSMSANTAIEWCDHTFNPWIGCTKVSPGCDHCYAEADFDRRRHVVTWGAGQERHATSATTWAQPYRWARNAEAFQAQHGRRQRVFCASLADVFDNEVPTHWRADLWALIRATPQLDWLLLTKRIGNAASMLYDADEPLPNVWIGATVVNQAEADRDVPKLLAVPAVRRFLSVEPMLGAIDIRRWLDRCDHGSRPGPGGIGGVTCAECDGADHGCRRLHWVICGGESGTKARPMSPAWARRLRDQCKAAGVPFLFKQWGEWIPMLGQVEGLPVRPEKAQTDDGWMMGFAGKKAAGRTLDGVTHDQYPTSAIGGAA
jgi:protein gp37